MTKKLRHGTKKKIIVPVTVIEDYGTGWVLVNVHIFKQGRPESVIVRRSRLK